MHTLVLVAYRTWPYTPIQRRSVTVRVSNR